MTYSLICIYYRCIICYSLPASACGECTPYKDDGGYMFKPIREVFGYPIRLGLDNRLMFIKGDPYLILLLTLERKNN